MDTRCLAPLWSNNLRNVCAGRPPRFADLKAETAKHIQTYDDVNGARLKVASHLDVSDDANAPGASDVENEVGRDG